MDEQMNGAREPVSQGLPDQLGEIICVHRRIEHVTNAAGRHLPLLIYQPPAPDFDPIFIVI